MLDLPRYDGEGCKGCGACVAACPGLAISLVRSLPDRSCEVVLPYELSDPPEPGERRLLVGRDGEALEEAELLSRSFNARYKTWTLRFKVSPANATRAIGLRAQAPKAALPPDKPGLDRAPDEAIVCRCERITYGELRRFIAESGARDINQLKAIRAGMGACGSKTCGPLYAGIFRSLGIDPGQVADGTQRPLSVEVPLGVLAAGREADR